MAPEILGDPVVMRTKTGTTLLTTFQNFAFGVAFGLLGFGRDRAYA